MFVSSSATTALFVELAALGNAVRYGKDGAQALDIAGSFRPGVMIHDIGMPKLNGYKVCRRIREQPWGKAVVTIALTGWGQDGDKRRPNKAVFDHHLVKPIDPEVLEQLLVTLQQ